MNDARDRRALLMAKFQIPPLPPDYVLRQRLHERLRSGFRTRLTLLSAPPGFGKTMLISDWIQRKNIPAAWLSLDEGDSDPIVFLSYVLRAVQNVAPQAVRAAQAMLLSPHPVPAETILTALMNDLQSEARDMALVLDDYHHIESPDVQNLVNFALRHLPRSLHLIISTRSDPPLALARLRSLHDMVEIRADELSFTEEESLRFFHQIPQLALSRGEIHELSARNEGWIAGLKMTVLSLRENKEASNIISTLLSGNRYIADYLLEETLNRQAVHVQEFLLQTSILSRLCGPLCDAVTDRKDSQELLALLEKANMFVFPIDAKRSWYRYHQMFADLLRRRLLLGHADRLPELHKRAGAWHARFGRTSEAIEHILEAGDFKTAAELIDNYAGSLWDRGLQFRLLAWFHRLPEGLIDSMPGLALYKIRALIMSGRYGEAEVLLDSVESHLAARGKSPSAISAQWRGRLNTLQGYLAMYRGEIEKVHDYALPALKMLPAEDWGWRCVAAGTLSQAHSWAGDGRLEESRKAFLEASRLSRESGNPYFELFVRNCLAWIEVYQGRVPDSMKMAEDLIAYAESKNLHNTGLASSVHALLGYLHYERNDMEKGLALLEESLELAARSQDQAALAGNRLTMFSLLADLGDGSGSQALLSSLESQASENPLPPWILHSIAAARGTMLLNSGNIEAAAHWARERGLDANVRPHQRLEREHEVLARLFLEQNLLEAADLMLRRWIRASEAGQRVLSSMSFRMLRSAALLKMGNDLEARQEMRRVLARAEKGGFFRLLVTRDPYIKDTLEKILTGYGKKREIFSKAYVQKILSAHDSALMTAGSPSPPEILSVREVEILRLLAQGFSNQEISEKLFISLNTVRTHTKNIHLKLNAHSRTQALARAKERGIL